MSIMKNEIPILEYDGDPSAVNIRPLKTGVARLTVDRRALTPTNRIDVAVFGRGAGTRWSAPSFVSFAVVDPSAPYSDPVLTPLAEPKADAE